MNSNVFTKAALPSRLLSTAQLSPRPRLRANLRKCAPARTSVSVAGRPSESTTSSKSQFQSQRRVSPVFEPNIRDDVVHGTLSARTSSANVLRDINL
jgi:hypothetical protein